MILSVFFLKPICSTILFASCWKENQTQKYTRGNCTNGDSDKGRPKGSKAPRGQLSRSGPFVPPVWGGQPSGAGQGGWNLKLGSEIHTAVQKHPPHGVLPGTAEGLLWEPAVVLIAPSLISGERLFKTLPPVTIEELCKYVVRNSSLS